MKREGREAEEERIILKWRLQYGFTREYSTELLKKYEVEDAEEHIASILPEEGVLNRSQITEWKARQNSLEKLRGWYYDSLKRISGKEKVMQHNNFTNVLAQLHHERWNMEALAGSDGELYRWKFVHDEVFEHNKVRPARDFVIPDGEESPELLYRNQGWLLQLKSVGGRVEKWHDWLLVKKSNVRGAGLGVFAARDFMKNTRIGCFVGRPVWVESKSQLCGCGRPCGEYLEAVGGKESKHRMLILNNECMWQVVEVPAINEDCEGGLYLGFQYMNNAAHLWIKGSDEYCKAGKKQNIMAEIDGSIVTVKRIMPGQELYFGYREDGTSVEGKAAEGKKKIKERRDKRARVCMTKNEHER